MHIHTTSVIALLLTLLFNACSSGTDVGKATENATDDAPITGAPPVAAPMRGTDAGGIVVTDPNPEHGRPGHRCEIPVGASLSTAPAPGAANTSATIPMEQPAVVAPPASDGQARSNPAHGEPGHDCNVAVGAPLP
ncbi:MAG TPA: hypothetical protein VGE21_08650 [Flavobacteriales bacterium]